MQNMPTSLIEEAIDKAGIVIDMTPLKVQHEPSSQVWNDLVEKLVSE